MLLTDFESIMRRYSSGVSRWVVGLSGGLDSTVLLHKLVSLKRQWSESPEIVVVHINHGLQHNAMQWQQQCGQLCEQWHVAFDSHVVAEKPDTKDSVEAWARQQRYAYFASMMQGNDLLITAHHQNDQVETLLLQSLRGAGPYGLAGMPLIKPFAGGQLLRPLLNESRQSLRTYAQKQHLTWIEDPSNANTLIDRNYVRHQVIPVMQKRWPELNKTMARSARLLADSLELLDDLAAIDMPRVLSDYPNSLSIAGLQTLSYKRQQHVIRYWLRQRGLPMPSEDQLQQLFESVIAAAEDAQPFLSWQHQNITVIVRRYRDLLTVAPEHDVQIISVDQWHTNEPLVIADGLSVSYQELFGEDMTYANKTLQVKWQQSGSSIKKFFQSKDVPTWLRSSLPLFYHNDELIKQLDYTVLVRYLLSH